MELLLIPVVTPILQLLWGDAIAAIKAPVVEVHISNIFGREDFRKLSLVSGKSVGVISGLGLKGYALAVEYFLDK